MKYKALIVDVDGTLIPNRRDGMPSKRVTEAINKASKLIHVGVATSRCLPVLGHIFDHLNLSGPSIINGGAQIIDVRSKKHYTQEFIFREKALAISNELKKSNISFSLCDGVSKDSGPSKNPYIPAKSFMVYAVNLDITFAKKLQQKLTLIPDIAAHTTPSWEKGKYDILITHAHATKQHGILQVAQLLHIKPHEIIGIGDGSNDFPLLMACGLKVAMGNAVQELKEIADYIAPTVENDGVADVIEKFILQPS